jgi:glyoxylase-like metal-dependent hydrolase (beta-lactamase superfamily II)
LFKQPEVVLVDTGVASDESWQVLTAALAQHNLTLADVERVIITHAHVDHLGAAARIAAHSQAQIWIADLGAAWLLDPERQWQKRIAYYEDVFLPGTGLSLPARQMVLAAMTMAAQGSHAVAGERVSTFTVGDLLQMGGRPWQVLHMPGHASHQTCFYQAETAQFISADMLLHVTPTPIVEDPGDGRDRVPALPLYLQSLARVEQLQMQTVYPGHGVIITEPYVLIEGQRERIFQRQAETLQLIKKGHQTVAELVNIMYAHYPERLRFAGLWMLMGYLDLLKEDEAIVEREVDGVWVYEATA